MMSVRKGLFSVLLLVAGTNSQEKDGQDKSEPISLHVKEVHRTQESSASPKGAWYHITAVAESKTIIYSLRCEEFFSDQKADFTLKCFQLSAGKDYSARKGPTFINFWPPGETRQGTTLGAYVIVSEKEK